MNTKHTPGPWQARTGTANTAVYSGPFAVAIGCRADDARLIAAAPELLAELLATGDALTELCSLLLRGQFDAAEDWAKANADELARSRAATIAKATGHD